MNNNNIGDYGLNQLLEAIKKNSVLKILRLDGNKISDVGFHTLIAAVRTSCISELSVENNEITDKGLDELALVPTNLEILNLKRNRIIELGSLPKGLEKDNKLKYLFLDSNNITENGVIKLLQSLTNDKGLIKITLSDNDIDHESLECL